MTFERPLPATHHCRHYSYERGMNWSGPKCAAGIDLSAPGANCKPCMPDHPIAGDVCLWREEFTETERAAWEAWRALRQERAIKILQLIPGNSTDRKNKPEWGNSGQFACPACEVGTVRWGRARVNGHLHAACTTPGCFGMMQ